MRCSDARTRPGSSRRLSTSNRLVIELDSREPRYRCHHLLSEALLAQLATVEPESVRTLHLRASVWFEESGDLDSAVRHAKQSGDLARVGDLVWSGIGGCVGSGRPDRLQHWLGGLTDREIASDRWLTLSAAWLALQLGDLDRRERWSVRAEASRGSCLARRASSMTSTPRPWPSSSR